MNWIGKIFEIGGYPYRFVGVAELRNGMVDLCPKINQYWLPIELPIHKKDLEMLLKLGRIQVIGEAPKWLIDILRDPDYDVELDSLEEAEKIKAELFRLTLIFQRVVTETPITSQN